MLENEKDGGKKKKALLTEGNNKHMAGKEGTMRKKGE